MIKNIFFISCLFFFSTQTCSYVKNERFVGALGGLATTVCLDSVFDKSTYAQWELWKILANTASWNEDTWFGPIITLIFETFPKLDGHEKSYYMSRF